MKRFKLYGGLALWLALALVPALSMAQVQVGIAVNSGGDSFNLAVGNYYHAPPEQVEVIQQRHIPEEEAPVVFFIAAHAHVTPQAVIDLRARGMGWGAIAMRYHLGANAFYVPVQGNFNGTPYDGFYRNYRRPGYRMADADIVNMVNLRFASDYYHKPASEIIHLRAQGRNFRDIHEQYHPYKMESQHGRPPEAKQQGRDDHHDARHDDHHNDHHDDHHDDHHNDHHDDMGGH